ncbi:MAG: serine hydrolase domain-containing protein [Myxococcota bacterium]
MPLRLPRALVLSLVLAACGKGQSPASTPPQAPVEAPAAERVLDPAAVAEVLDAHVASFGAKWGEPYAFSGFVLVAEKGEPVYAKGFGKANRETGQVPDIDTNFRVGSVTKQFTAAAILALAEDGVLSVDDPVSKYLPGWPRGEEITIHHLLTHTAGVWNYTSDADFMAKAHEYHSTDQMLAVFRDTPLEFEPGEQFSYSNSGYVMLGAIIEAATGKPYGEVLAAQLFEPAGLTRTRVGDATELTDRAEGYTVTPGEKIEGARAIDMSVPHGAGAVRSTAADLLAWHAMLDGDQILSASSREVLYKPAKNDYAYGWIITKAGDKRLITHGGGIFGFNTYYARLPEDDIVIVAWTNHDTFEVGQIGNAALAVSVGDTVVPHVEADMSPVEPELAKTLVGNFAMTAASRKKLETLGTPAEVIETIEAIEVKFEEGSMSFKPNGQLPLPLYTSPEGNLVTRVANVTLTWETKEDGTVDLVRMAQGMMVLEYQRQP